MHHQTTCLCVHVHNHVYCVYGHVGLITLTFGMLAYAILKYALKCAPSETVSAHFSGYLKQNSHTKTML